MKKNSFSGAVLWNSLPIYCPAAGDVSWGFSGLAANNSSGDLHGTYGKQTKALSLIRFWDKTKVSRFWRPSWASKFHELRLRRMRKVHKSVFPF